MRRKNFFFFLFLILDYYFFFFYLLFFFSFSPSSFLQRLREIFDDLVSAPTVSGIHQRIITIPICYSRGRSFFIFSFSSSSVSLCFFFLFFFLFYLYSFSLSFSFSLSLVRTSSSYFQSCPKVLRTLSSLLYLSYPTRLLVSC